VFWDCWEDQWLREVVWEAQVGAESEGSGGSGRDTLPGVCRVFGSCGKDGEGVWVLSVMQKKNQHHLREIKT